MKERLAYFLKHNLIAQKIYKTVIGFLLRIVGIFVKTDPNMILFVSFMGKKFGDSPKVIYEYLRNNKGYEQYRCVWAFERPSDYPQLHTVKMDSLRYFMTALKARYWVTNTNVERGMTFKKRDQVYLNTWHGVALKHIGNDCPGRKDYNFRTVDHLCVSGDHDEQVFRTAFNASEDRYLRCGMPRNDELWFADEDSKAQARERLGIPDNKSVILYAPTWRESDDKGKTYAIRPPVDFGKWQEQLGDRYMVLFRAHHLTTQILNVEFNDFIRDVSEYPEVNDLMISSDMMITDYSAIAFDYAILGKPLLTFAYDYDTYLAERGTYFDMDQRYPGKSCRTEEELLQKIAGLDVQEESKKTIQFRDEFVQYGRNAAATCVDALFADCAATVM